MKRFFIAVLTVAALWRCDEVPSEVINNPTLNYEVISVNVPDSVRFSTGSPELTLNFQVDDNTNITSVAFSVISEDGEIEIEDHGEMKDNGNSEDYGDAVNNDGIYSGKITLSQDIPKGNYVVTFYVSDKLGLNKTAALKSFYYNNSAIEYPPVISNLSLASQVNTNAEFDFSVKVTDKNGANDIKKVYYRLFRPDGTQQQDSQGNKEFEIYDDGSSQVFTGGITSHDATAGDGIYTGWLAFPTGTAKGDWKFEFEAVDRENNLSEVLTKTVELK